MSCIVDMYVCILIYSLRTRVQNIMTIKQLFIFRCDCFSLPGSCKPAFIPNKFVVLEKAEAKFNWSLLIHKTWVYSKHSLC